MPPHSKLSRSQPRRQPRCNFCLKECKSASHVQLHIQNKPECRKKWDKEVEQRPTLLRSNRPVREPISTSKASEINDPPTDYDNNDDFEPFMPSPRQLRSDPSDSDEQSEPTSKRARVEEVEDEEEPGRYYKSYPEGAAKVLGEGLTGFEEIQASTTGSSSQPDNPWGPFKDKEEWQLAEWLMKSTTQKARDEFLKLPIVSLL